MTAVKTAETTNPRVADKDLELSARGLRVGYGEHEVIPGIDVTLPAGKITTIIGPNGCGKSTFLKAISRLMPFKGEVTIGGTSVMSIPRKKLATIIGVLPQSPSAPEGIIVADLVSRGRHPHQTWFNQWSRSDEGVVELAMKASGIADLESRPLDSLSGGQRQRAWIAMVLAQETDILMLDEPTTFLDLSHSVDVLRTVTYLRDEMKRTIIMVLHDINLAVRYSDHLVVMKNGKIVSTGAPKDVITSELLKEVFSLEAKVIPSPLDGSPVILPI